MAVGLAEAQHDHRQVGEREREHRAEGEDAGEELDVGDSVSPNAIAAASTIAT